MAHQLGQVLDLVGRPFGQEGLGGAPRWESAALLPECLSNLHGTAGRQAISMAQQAGSGCERQELQTPTQ